MGRPDTKSSLDLEALDWHPLNLEVRTSLGRHEEHIEFAPVVARLLSEIFTDSRLLSNERLDRIVLVRGKVRKV